MQIVLYIILVVISGLLLMGLLPAAISLTAMGTGIAGGGAGGMGLEGVMYMGPRALSRIDLSGSVVGLWLGVGVLFCVIFALLGQVAVMGQNLVYLQASASIDSTGEAQALDGVWNDVRKRAEEAKERAKAAAERARQVAAQKAQEVAAANAARKAAAAEQAPGAAQAPSCPSCPSCHGQVGSTDIFCEHCGHKLKP